MDTPEIRRKILPVGRNLLKSLLRKDHETIYRIDGLPADSYIVSVQTQVHRDGMFLVIESDEFDHVPPGQEYPTLNLTISQRFVHEEARNIAEALYDELFSVDRPDEKAELVDDMAEVIKDVKLNEGEVKGE